VSGVCGSADGVREGLADVDAWNDDAKPGFAARRLRGIRGVIAFVRWFVLPRRQTRFGGRL
jgi:hypothetical protein